MRKVFRTGRIRSSNVALAVMLADEEDTSSLEDDGVLVLDGMDEGLRKSTWRLIASVALPASLANASPVLLTTAQTALLGHGKGGAVALAAYGWVLTSSGGRLRALSSLALALTRTTGLARSSFCRSVSTTISMATRVSTFLMDATSAKCGLAVGQRDWRRLAESIRGSLAWAVALGLISVLLLYAAKPFVFARLLSLRGDVLRDAESYWVFAVGKLPFQLVNLSISGGLQGFGPERVRLVALISTLAAAVELLVDCVVVYVGGSGGASLLWKFGLVGLAVAALQAGAGMALLLTVKPVEAGDEFSLTARLTDNDAMAAEDDEDDEDDDARVVLKDGMVDMLVRSLVMQGSFLVALVAVSVESPGKCPRSPLRLTHSRTRVCSPGLASRHPAHRRTGRTSHRHERLDDTELYRGRSRGGGHRDRLQAPRIGQQRPALAHRALHRRWGWRWMRDRRRVDLRA